MEVNR